MCLDNSNNCKDDPDVNRRGDGDGHTTPGEGAAAEQSEARRRRRAGERKTDIRRLARQIAVQFLYQLDAQNGENLGWLTLFLNEYSQDGQVKQLAAGWIKGAWQQKAPLDELIKQTSVNWDLSRLTQVDHSILRLAVYQLWYCPDIPPKAVIDEALELAKIFSTAPAPAFVNGILDTIFKKLAGKDKQNLVC